MSLIADIFITHKPGRPELLEKTLEALSKNTDREKYRLTIIVDGAAVPPSFLKIVPDHLLVQSENLGLGPSINQALAHIDSLNRYYEHPTHGDPTRVAPFICYLQDDILVSKGWLEKMSMMFLLFERTHKLGFASGIECVEHPAKKNLGNGMILKDWIRASNMFAHREYWMSMFPITRFDPETGKVRAKPNDGMGSGVDWWFIRDHENSVCRTGRTNLVFPGMMVHAGYDKSTWLKRELPESIGDKQVIKNELKVCLDPEKMNGYADQFGGSDYE